MTLSLLVAASIAQAQECKYLEESVGPATGKKIIKTTWDKITGKLSGMSGGSVEGSVQGISVGDAKYLGVNITSVDYYPIPADLNINPEETNIITKKGIYDPRLTAFMNEVNVDALVVPEGSTLRITMEDRTTVVLASITDVAVRGNSTRPGNSDNSSPHIRTRAKGILQYALDQEAIDALSNHAAINMRLETRDKYYSFESRTFPKHNAQWREKYNYIIQGVLKCVL